MLDTTAGIVIAIIDDHPVVIEGIKTLLRQELGTVHVVSFTRGSDFMSFLGANEVHIALLDIMLPDANGVNLCKDIKNMAPATIVLALSNQAERSIILQMLQNGAGGYLLKNASAEELIRCVREAMEGMLTFSEEVKAIMAKPGRNEWRDTPAVTKREKQILKLVAEGQTTAMMAAALHLSPLTIDTHRRNLLQKFEVRNTAELIMAAVQQNLL